MPDKIDKEKVKNTIAVLLDTIKTDADIHLHAEYFRLFKKEISLFNRSKAGAYLLMLLDQEKNLIFKEKYIPAKKKSHHREAANTP